MHYQSRSVAVLCLGLATGFGAAFNAPSCSAQENATVDASQVAFTTPNLVNNGDFDLGTSNWITSGAGLKWRVVKDQAIFNLSPIPGAPASQLSLSQNTQRAVRQGKTLALRFQAQGVGQLNAVIYETSGEKRTLLARRLTVTNANTPQTFTVALKTPNYYYAGQLGLKFHLGFGATTLALSQIRLVDLGDTPFDGLNLTPDETKLPELMPVKTETPKVEEQPVEVKTNAVMTPQGPLTLETGTNLVRNAEFAEQDKYWKAFGEERVSAALEGKNLKLRIMPNPGEAPELARFEQEIETPIKKGDKLTVRFRAAGNAKFAVKLADANDSLLVKEENAEEGGKEYFYLCEANRDYAANEAKIVFVLGYRLSEITFSDIQVLTPKL